MDVAFELDRAGLFKFFLILLRRACEVDLREVEQFIRALRFSMPLDGVDVVQCRVGVLKNDRSAFGDRTHMRKILAPHLVNDRLGRSRGRRSAFDPHDHVAEFACRTDLPILRLEVGVVVFAFRIGRRLDRLVGIRRRAFEGDFSSDIRADAEGEQREHGSAEGDGF